jgi:hypothetical protein
MENRYKFLQELFEFEKPLDTISAQLKSLDWDFDGEPLVLEKKHVASALNLYISGAKSANQLERWANLIEMREDIDFGEADEKLINDTIYKLANPELEGELTLERCKQYLNKLNL